MFKFTRKMSPNFEGGTSFCVKGGASRNRKNLRSGWAISAARSTKLGWFLLALLCPAFSSAQVSERWVARYHGSVDGSTDRAVAMALDSAGNVYVTGQSQGAGTGLDYATVEYDPNGNQLLAVLDQDRNVLQGAPYSTFAHAIVVDSALGHAYVTGGVALIRDGTVEARTVAYDSAGDPLWGADENGPPGYCEDQWGVAIALGRDGNVFLTAHCLYGFNAGHAYSTLGYDPTGKRLWSVPYQTFPGSEAEASSIATDN